jgi:hypothetical protein
MKMMKPFSHQYHLPHPPYLVLTGRKMGDVSSHIHITQTLHR